MSTFPSEVISTTDEPLANIPNYPGADIILRSRDSHHLRVPKVFIIHNSPVLSELVRRTLESPGDTNAEAPLPVVQLPESGKILRHLISFILPPFPAIPPTDEETMELLSVAQKYQMEAVLVHVRGIIARQNPLPTRLEPALHIYALAQKYGLRPEALRSTRTILKHSMTVEDLGDKLDIMPGASLYELWKYYERVRTILALNLTEFRESGARGTMTVLGCTELSSSQMPSWVDQYIVAIGNAPNLFDPLELNISMTRHIKNVNQGCNCGSISSQTIHDFWGALASVVNDSFEKVSVMIFETTKDIKSLQAESGLTLVQEREDPSVQINLAMSPPDDFDVPDANVIIQSSDLVNFRVHKPVLAMASPVFKVMLSLPQPSDSESVGGLPVVRLSEDSDLLNTLVSMLYHLRPVIPKSYEKVLYSLVTFSVVVPNACYKVLYLLAACEKYEIAAIQSSIRDKVSRGEFPAPKGAEAFSAYLIASNKGLIPEMESAARQTLDHPMTFEIIGEGLRLSEGWALRDLTNFRKRYRDNLVSSFGSFFNIEESQFNIWTTCAYYTYNSRGMYPSTSTGSYSRSYLSMFETNKSLPSWLAKLYQKHLDELREGFSKSLFNSRSIRGEYSSALQAHINLSRCVSCTKVHIEKGEIFCKDLEDRLTQALNEVCFCSIFWSCGEFKHAHYLGTLGSGLEYIKRSLFSCERRILYYQTIDHVIEMVLGLGCWFLTASLGALLFIAAVLSEVKSLVLYVDLSKSESTSPIEHPHWDTRRRHAP